MESIWSLPRDVILTAAMTCISRFLIARDRFLGRVPQAPVAPPSRAVVSRHAIPSGKNVLDGVLVTPAEAPIEDALLLCHGIGETVEHWSVVQHLIAANGVASLVFDYSGYGRSSGFISALQCEQDAIAAFHFLRQRLPSCALSILGFSLGSGIAASILPKIAADRLILCAAFTSLRAAARSLGLPGALTFLVPPLWSAAQLRDCAVPVLIVHGEQDELFPVQMAHDLRSCCNRQSELVIVPDLSHNQPFYRPQSSYWNRILSRIARASPTGAR